MPLAEKGVRGKGRQALSPPQHAVTPERDQRSVSNNSVASPDSLPVAPKRLAGVNFEKDLDASHPVGNSMIAAAAAVILVLPVTASAQWLNYPTPGVPRLPDGKPNLNAPTPRTPDGKPDLSGLWDVSTEGARPLEVLGEEGLPAQFLDIAAGLKGGLPYTPLAREILNARLANNQKDSPDGKCLPLGMVWMLSHRFPRKIVQVAGLVLILYEKNIEYRQIFTDGRPLPNDPQPSFNGYSSGKWVGDTLVVETIRLHDGLWADVKGNPVTEAAKVTEKLRRLNYASLEDEVTVNDPKAYTAPWTIKLNYGIKLDTDMLEYVCLENQKDLPHLVGK